MAFIKIESFSGERPSVDPRQLSATHARINSNLLISAPDFRPLMADRVVTPGSGATLYRRNRTATGEIEESATGGFVTNAAVVNYVKAQLNDDLTDRTYYSFNDGVTPPRAMDALGVDKRLGITPPAKPMVVANFNDEFTPEDRVIGIEGSKQSIVAAIRSSAITRYIGGITGVELGSINSPELGFIDAFWDGPKQVRTYRMGSTGGANNGPLTNAYSSAPLSSFDWIRDPSLGGFWATTDATSPSWQGGSGIDHWCITFPAFATSYTFDSSALRSALAAVLRPGQSDGTPMFTDEQLDGSDGMVSRLVAYTSQSNPLVAPTIAAFMAELRQLRLILDQGASSSLTADRSAFYSQASVTQAVSAAFDNFAQAINADAKYFTSNSAGGTEYTNAEIKTTALARWAPDSRGIYALDITRLETDMRDLFATVATGTEGVQYVANQYDPRPLINTLKTSIGEDYLNSTSGVSAQSQGQTAAAIVAKKANIERHIRDINRHYAWMKEELGAGTLLDAVNTFFSEKDVESNVAPGVIRIIDTRYYVMTWVTSWGEESAPSPVSDVVEVDENDECVISWSVPAPESGVIGWRLYRSNVGSQTTAFQLLPGDRADNEGAQVTPTGTPTEVINSVYVEIGRVGEAAPGAVDIAYWVNLQAAKDLTNVELRTAMLYAAITYLGDPTWGVYASNAKALLGTATVAGVLTGSPNGFSILLNSYTDRLLSSDLAEVIPTTTWLPPPTNLQGLVGMANGIMAGYFDNALCFCEPYVGYAWPVQYQIPIKYPIRGLGTCGNSVFVGTKGNPYIVTGTDSASMSAREIPSGQACVSQRSIASVMGAVIYASPDGLCLIDEGGVNKVATSGHFTKKDWMALNPFSIVACVHDQVYYFTYANDAGQGAYAFDYLNGKLVRLDLSCTAMFNDLATDAIFYLADGNINALFDAATERDGVYHTGTIKLPKQAGFAWLQVDSPFTAPVTVKVYGDGALIRTAVLDSIKPVRMPPGMYLEYEVEITSQSTLTSLLLTSSTAELQTL